MKTTDLRNEIRIRNNNIANIIENGMDEDGVLTEEAFEALTKSDEKKNELILGVVEGFQGYKILADAVKAKFDRLKALEKYYRNTESSLKSIMLQLVPEGESFNTEDYSLSWRKSKSVLIDGFASLKEIESKYPHTIKTEKSFIKTELKKLLNEGVEIEGVIIEEKNNLQIK